MSESLLVPDTLLVGIGHRARQGKTSLANYLAVKLSGEVRPYGRVYAFADAVKTYCRVQHGMVGKNAPLLQQVGHGMRAKDPEIWIRCVAEQIREERPACALIADVRYQNEFEWIRAAGGILVKVERTLPDGDVYTATDRPATHVSEVDLIGAPWDYTLVAPDGLLQTLFTAAGDLLVDIRHTMILQGADRMRWLASTDERLWGNDE